MMQAAEKILQVTLGQVNAEVGIMPFKLVKIKLMYLNWHLNSHETNSVKAKKITSLMVKLPE